MFNIVNLNYMDGTNENYSGGQGLPQMPTPNIPPPTVGQTPQQPQTSQSQPGYPPTGPVVQPQAPVQPTETPPVAPQPGQSVQGQVPPQGSKSGQKILVGLSVVTLVVAAVGGFYLGASGLLNGGSLTPTPTPTPPFRQESSTSVEFTPTPSPMPEVVQQPLIYDSQKFSFSYPGYFSQLALRLEEDGVEIQPRTFEALYLAPGQEGSEYTALLQVVGPEANPDGFKLKQWLGETGKLAPEGLEADIASTTIADKEASIITGYRPGTNDPGLIGAYFELDDGVYSVVLKIAEGASEAAKYESDFDTIVASISFK